jgi:glycosyltransferase involved in cell wall biosynthesis
MRIGIDARPLGHQRTGVGNYVYNLAGMLPSLAPEHDWFLYSNREIRSPLPSGVFQERKDDAFRFCPGSFWLMLRGGPLTRKDHLNVFWSTAAMLPPGIPKGVLKIVTVYDLVWLRFPQTMNRYNLYVHKIFAERSIRAADLVIVISRSTGEELTRLLGIPAEKIKVVYPGISERYKPGDTDRAAEYISKKYGVPQRYLAAVGTLEPRKNLGLLVKVLRILKAQGKHHCPVLIAGGSGWRNSGLFNEIQAAGLTEAEIKFLGYVPDEDLPSFYTGAQLFLFPSLYEGFGIPPLEAMACGVPVVASNARCMPETLGGAAILESPDSPDRFAQAVIRGLEDEDVRRSLEVDGINRAREFSWERSAGQLLDAFSDFSKRSAWREAPAGAVL